MPVGKTAHIKFGGKARKGGRKAMAAKAGAKKMPFGATKAPGARKTQPMMKKAMGGKMGAGIKKGRKKKS